MINKLDLNLSDLKEIGSNKHLSLEVDFHDLEFVNREIEIKKPILLELDIFNTSDSFVVEGSLKAEIILSCSRCLEKYNSKLELNISEDVMKADMEDEEELYLDEIIIDNIILSLPMKPLCAEDCKGICPQCGQNLNQGECDCKVEMVDPRLEKLKEFYDSDGNE